MASPPMSASGGVSRPRVVLPRERRVQRRPLGEPEATEKDPHSNAGSWGWDPRAEQSGETGGRVAAGDGWDWAGRTSRGGTGWALVPRGGLRKGPEEGAWLLLGPSSLTGSVEESMGTPERGAEDTHRGLGTWGPQRERPRSCWARGGSGGAWQCPALAATCPPPEVAGARPSPGRVSLSLPGWPHSSV